MGGMKMIGNLARKFTPVVLTLSLLSAPSLVSAEKTKVLTKQEKREILNKKLDFLREQVRKSKDFEKALKATTEKYKSLKVVDSDPEPLKSKNEISALSSYNEPGWLDLTDRVVYDDEIEEYVFVGYWEWDEDEGFVGDQPYDLIGVYTDSTSIMPIDPDGVVLQGWNGLGDEEAFFDTGTDKKSGKVALAKRANSGGAAFWINDRYVTNGMITAILDGVSTSSKYRAYIQYDHSWTDTSITGIGGSVSGGAGGFNISWQSKVEYFPSLYSNGDYFRD
jgi:hypothetical protein